MVKSKPDDSTVAIQFLRENVHWRSQSLQQPIKAGKIMISSGNYPGLIALIDGINCRTSSHCRWAFDCIWIPDITVSGPLSQPLPDKPLTINNQKSHALPGQQALHRFVHLRFITHESTTAWCFFLFIHQWEDDGFMSCMWYVGF